MVVQASDDRTFVRGTGPAQVVSSAVPDDRNFVRRIGRGDFDAIPVSQPTTIITTPDDGFHWGDAGIGLGIGIALMLLAAGAIVTLRRARHTLAHQ